MPLNKKTKIFHSSIAAVKGPSDLEGLIFEDSFLHLRHFENMWSDRYFYFNIQKDDSLSEDCDTTMLRDFLSGIPELEQVSDFEFKNKDSFPFTSLSLLKVRDPNNWSGNDTNSFRTNLLPIVCQKSDEITSQRIIAVLIKIAAFLNWELVDEQTDEGIENYRVWEPSQSPSKLD